MRRQTQIAIIVGFALLVSIPLVAFGFGARSETADNQPRQELPEVSASALLDDDFYADVGEAFVDRIPGRDQAIELDAEIDQEVFGDSPTPVVGFGADGWLFHRNTWLPQCDGVDVQAVTAQLRELMAVLETDGAQVALIVSPDKGLIYPDKRGPLDGAFECADRVDARFRAALRGDPPSGFIDAWQTLDDLRLSTDEPLYFAHDTHWTSFAAIAMAEQVMDTVAPGTWDPESVELVGPFELRGDVTLLTGQPEERTVNQWRAAIDGIRVRRASRDQNRPIEWTARGTNRNPVLPARALVIHDSFGGMMQRPLANYFEQTTFVHWQSVINGFVTPAEIAELVRDSDYVAVQSVQRLVPALVQVDLPDFGQVLAAELAALGPR